MLLKSYHPSSWRFYEDGGSTKRPEIKVDCTVDENGRLLKTHLPYQTTTLRATQKAPTGQQATLYTLARDDTWGAWPGLQSYRGGHHCTLA